VRDLVRLILISASVSVSTRRKLFQFQCRDRSLPGDSFGFRDAELPSNSTLRATKTFGPTNLLKQRRLSTAEFKGQG
jgi:hypothetical protein